MYRRVIQKNGLFQHTVARRRLPIDELHEDVDEQRFNTQSREGGCAYPAGIKVYQSKVSTHSRAKAAAAIKNAQQGDINVSTHSRAKAAAISNDIHIIKLHVSTHSRAKAAAPYIKKQ